MLKLLKNWTLPIAMLIGAIAYLLFVHVSFLAPIKPMVEEIVAVSIPLLIFLQLLLTFCKIDPRELKPVRWHWWLLLFQLFSCILVAMALIYSPMPLTYSEVFEAAMVCLICPTATAAAVITRKLGGNAGSLATYTLFSNLLAAIVVPLVFPMVEPRAELGFFMAFLRILSKVFPLLLCPFILAYLLRLLLPKVHQCLAKLSDFAFYLWAIALAIVSGQIIRSIVNSNTQGSVKLLIALAGLITCCLQFYLGKRIGGHYKERISGGQALGQKNTILAIWMAHTYLNPITSLGPGFYVLWQNIINSYQLWKKGKAEDKKST